MIYSTEQALASEHREDERQVKMEEVSVLIFF